MIIYKVELTSWDDDNWEVLYYREGYPYSEESLKNLVLNIKKNIIADRGHFDFSEFDKRMALNGFILINPVETSVDIRL